MTVDTASAPAVSAQRRRMPWPALLVMTLSGFLLIATETMPAGLLPQIADGMRVTEGVVGQYVSAYALGTVLATLPAIALTRGMRRKPLLLIGLGGFLVANTVTAVSGDIVVALVARFAAGACSGLLWGMLAGYARRIAPPELAGRAIAVATAGTPIGLAIGTPFGAWLGAAADWRWSFILLSALTVVAILLALALVPDAPGQEAGRRVPAYRVALIPGVTAILAVIFLWMLGHNTFYTYVSGYVRSAALPVGVDVVLVLFGLFAIVGILVTGALVDRMLRPLVLASVSLFVVAGALFAVGQSNPIVVLIAVALWGVAFGGAAPQLLTAIGRASGKDADIANALLATTFNVAIFAAGVLGAVVVGTGGPAALPVILTLLALSALVVVVAARRSAFPVRSGAAEGVR